MSMLRQAGMGPGAGVWRCMVFVLAWTLAAFAYGGETLARIRQTQTIVLGYDADLFPFSYETADGRIAGYSIDICIKIAEAFKRELKLPQLKIDYLKVDATTRFASIAGGKADIECGATTNNTARRRQFAFTVPHFYTATRMVVRKNLGVRNWIDLHNRRVAVLKGSAVADYAKSRDNPRVLNIAWREIDADSQALPLVEKGEVEAYVDDDVFLHSMLMNVPRPDEFVITGDALWVDPYSMMMNKKDADFKAVVDREMVRMINQGDILKIYDRWFMHEIPPDKRSMNMPMSYLLRDSFRFPTDKVAD